MRRRDFLILTLLLGGCAAGPPAVPVVDHAVQSKQATAALQDAKVEAATLRADLAAARIAVAKQEAELQELRRQVEELRQVVGAKQAELITLREERDRLAQTATVAQVHMADPSKLPSGIDEVNAMKAKMGEMETALTALAAELAQVKKAMGAPSPASSPKQGEDRR